MKKQGRTLTDRLSFFPSKDLLAEVIICENLDRFIQGRTVDSFTKEELVDRLMEGGSYKSQDNQLTVEEEVAASQIQELHTSLDPYKEHLLRLF